MKIPALQVAATAKSFQEVVDFVIEVEGVKQTTTPQHQHLRSFLRDMSLVFLTPEGKVQEVIQPVLFSLRCRLKLGVRRRPVSLFLSLEVIPRLCYFHKDLYLTPGILMDVERLDILGNIVQNRVTDPL